MTPLAPAGEVVGAEGAGFVVRARRIVQRKGIADATFHVADPAACQTEAPWAGRHHDRILLDPVATLGVVDNIRLARVVYVQKMQVRAAINGYPQSLCEDYPVTAWSGSTNTMSQGRRVLSG